MGRYNTEDILGLHTDREVVCFECLGDKEWDSMEEDEIITEHDTAGDSIYFCDRCKKRI